MLTDISNIGFVITYLVVGAIFATTVVSIPMLLDRPEGGKADPVMAGITSIRACLANPLVMGSWAALIAILVGVAMLPWFLGLAVVVPVIGHASWHAYRHIVIKPSAVAAAVDPAAPSRTPGAPRSADDPASQPR